MIKYGRVLTYEDIEEARKLIGKKVVYSDSYFHIQEHPVGCYVGYLDNVCDQEFDINESCSTYQFIREVIEEEPQYRPFKNVEELIEHWEKNYGNANRPKGTMPLIWVRDKSFEHRFLITGFGDFGVTCNGCFVTFKEFLEKYIFLDTEPCGVEVEV